MQTQTNELPTVAVDLHDLISATYLAKAIRNYIRDRAEVERADFDLTLRLFQECVLLGVSPILGVQHDGERLLGDYQEPKPGYFEGWMLEHDCSELMVNFAELIPLIPVEMRDSLFEEWKELLAEFAEWMDQR